MQQTGRQLVGRVPGFPGHLVQRVLAARRAANDLKLRHRFYRNIREVSLDALALDQAAVGYRRTGPRGVSNQPVLHAQPFHGHAQAFGGHGEQHRPRLGAGLSHDGNQEGSGHRTEGSHVVGAKAGVAHHHIHRVEGDIQLLGQRLRERCHRPLAELHFANQTLDAPVFADPQKRVEIRGCGNTARDAPRLLRRDRFGSEEDEQSRTREPREFPAAELPDFHHAPAFPLTAAC